MNCIHVEIDEEILEKQCEYCQMGSSCPVARAYYSFNYEKAEEGQEKLKECLELLIDSEGFCQIGGILKKQDETRNYLAKLVKNAIDFLKKSIEELNSHPKYSVINFCSALELFLKARVLIEHWSLVVANPEKAKMSKFKSGDFQSVSIDQAIDRIRNISDEIITKNEEDTFKEVKDHRNNLVHFFHPKYSEASDDETLTRVVPEQYRAWLFLYRFLSEKWRKHFSEYQDEIDELNELMHGHRDFLKEKFDSLQTEIKRHKSKGVAYIACFMCGHDSAKIEEYWDPLYSCTCIVCKATKYFLWVPCPDCESKIFVEESETGKCEKCGFETSIDYMIDKYGPPCDPKEESDTAYCAQCEYTSQPTVIPFGSVYLCLNCMELYDEDVGQCEWCSENVAGTDLEGSYLFGCVLCEGKPDRD